MLGVKIVVDSSVLIAAVKKEEPHHEATVRFFDRARRRGDDLLAPITVLWDIGAALDHPARTPPGTPLNQAADLAVAFLAVDEGLFQRAWVADARVAIKGPDRVFISFARDQKAIVVSWDRQLLANARSLGVEAVTPENAARP